MTGADAPLPDDLEEYAGRGAVLTSGDPSADPEAQALLDAGAIVARPLSARTIITSGDRR